MFSFSTLQSKCTTVPRYLVERPQVKSCRIDFEHGPSTCAATTLAASGAGRGNSPSTSPTPPDARTLVGLTITRSSSAKCRPKWPSVFCNTRHEPRQRSSVTAFSRLAYLEFILLSNIGLAPNMGRDNDFEGKVLSPTSKPQGQGTATKTHFPIGHRTHRRRIRHRPRYCANPARPRRQRSDRRH